MEYCEKWNRRLEGTAADGFGSRRTGWFGKLRLGGEI
jgi:hypothetical protein